MTQRKTIYQAVIHTQYLSVDTFTVGMSLHMRCVDKKKHALNETCFSKYITYCMWFHMLF